MISVKLTVTADGHEIAGAEAEFTDAVEVYDALGTVHDDVVAMLTAAGLSVFIEEAE